MLFLFGSLAARVQLSIEPKLPAAVRAPEEELPAVVKYPGVMIPALDAGHPTELGFRVKGHFLRLPNESRLGPPQTQLALVVRTPAIDVRGA